jgi:tetratricopeptide (TPR) repeat protein
MLTVQLQLVPTGLPVSTGVSAQKSSAWFLRGDDVQQWIDEIARWPVEQSDLELIVVPRGRSDRAARGLLVFGEVLAQVTIERSVKVEPFRCVGERLFIPADAKLCPEVTAGEVADLLLPENVYLWHPASGLVVADSLERLRVSDFLATPKSAQPQDRQDWGLANPGVKFVDRLSSIEGPAAGSLDDIISESRGDIGENAKDLKDWKRQLGNKPPDPDTPERVGKMTYAMAKLARWIAGKAPGGGSRRTWLNDLEDWANSKLSAVSHGLRERRHKELYRLQRLLEKDPDQGLKYALPVAGSMNHRGQGAASGSLAERNTNFRLGSLGGGGAADFWELPYEIRQRLTEQYRQLAQREIRLGRFRRAAYIYAELLSDLSSAAKALETGKHFREAATVYRSMLRREQEAVRCLEAGGLWQEAIELHRELDQFESAGDLLRRLGLDDRAEDEYAIAIEKMRHKGDHVGAARIEETKLDDPGQALKTLESGWPESRQAVACLEQTFRILAGLGEHERTRFWFQKILAQAETLKSLPAAVRMMADLATTYPDRSTQHAAADTTRRIVSAAIQSGRVEPSDGLVKCLAKLAPEDALLNRDCHRFLAGRLAGVSAEKKLVKVSRSPSPAVEFQHLKTLDLPAEVDWLRVVHVGESVVAIGQKGDELWAMRLPWSAKSVENSDLINRLIYSIPTTWSSPFVIAEYAGDRIGLVLHAIGDASFPVRTFHAMDSTPSEFDAGAVASLADDVLGVTLFGYDQLAVVRLVNDQFVLDTVSATGKYIDSQIVGQASEFGSPVIPIPMVSNGTHLYLGIGTGVRVFGRGGWIETFDLEEEVRQMATSARGTIARTAIGFERGVQVLWGGMDSELTAKFCLEMEQPHVLFTRSGHLVVAADNHCEIYRTIQRTITFVGSLAIQSCVDLVTTDSSQRFAVLSSDGKLREYRIPLK